MVFETGRVGSSAVPQKKSPDAGQAGNWSAAGASRGSVDDLTSIAILNAFGGVLRAAPFMKIRLEQTAARLIPHGQRRQVNPGNGRAHMMIQMPVVVEPDEIEQAKCLEVH